MKHSVRTKCVSFMGKQWSTLEYIKDLPPGTYKIGFIGKRKCVIVHIKPWLPNQSIDSPGPNNSWNQYVWKTITPDNKEELINGLKKERYKKKEKKTYNSPKATVIDSISGE